MHDPVGYSGVFLSSYKGRNDSLIIDSLTTRAKDDRPWYAVTRELRSHDDTTIIILHDELFLRDLWNNIFGRTAHRYRLIVNGELVPIVASESSYGWMNASSRPDEHRLITPVGVLVEHSPHERRTHDYDFFTWEDERLQSVDEQRLMLHAR